MIYVVYLCASKAVNIRQQILLMNTTNVHAMAAKLVSKAVNIR